MGAAATSVGCITIKLDIAAQYASGSETSVRAAMTPLRGPRRMQHDRRAVARCNQGTQICNRFPDSAHGSLNPHRNPCKIIMGLSLSGIPSFTTFNKQHS
jgi:hypothetical protein